MNIYIFLVVATVAGVHQVAGVTLKELALDEWAAFKALYGKKYASETEDQFRMKIYLQNRQTIAQHNKKGSFKLGMNQYGDLLLHEIKTTMNGFKPNLKRNSTGATFLIPENFVAPLEVDWRTKGLVTPIKDQGQCGSCWAFSVTGALEGQTMRKTGKLVSLSEQNLVDCSSENQGCDGGDMDLAFQYIESNEGIDTESTYPYEGVDGKCRYTLANFGADDTGFVDINPRTEEALKIAVAAYGPVSVAIDANHKTFQSYASGIYVEKDCLNERKDLDHAVLVVGYGTEEGQDYWLVKNSWGTSWGDKGYIKMARNLNNQCGIASEASYPLV